MSSIITTSHSHLLWRSRLSSALRTALACAIVGATTLYSPRIIRHHLKFPAFSYMIAVLIVGEATLGNAVRGAACVLRATALGLIPAILTLYIMMQLKNITATTISVAVAISSFAVAISDSTALITKRVALGQIAIVYDTVFKEAVHVTRELNPVPVAASSAVGAVAAVLALVLPYPRLSYCQVRKKRELYTEIALERLRLLVNGICADSGTCMVAWASQAKSLTVICAKLLQNINLVQESMKWERIFLSKEQGDTLEQIEMPLKGMEMALVSTASSSLKVLNQQLKDDLISKRNKICLKIRQEHISMTKSDIQLDKTLESLHVIVPQSLQDLPHLFFLFCTKLLLNVGQSIPSPDSLQDNKVIPTTDGIANSYKKEEPSTMRANYFKGVWPIKVSMERFMTALKCSLSLSLAVLFGVLFSSDNGCWAGLAVAIAYTPFGDATFRSASVRVHGTALGSVYGLLGSFVSQNLMEVRLLVLLPWIVFTSFLHRSRMYGQVGGFAATISAMIILGRRNYGSPMIFAAQRLTETCIGLCCAILFELLLQPKRASTLARAQLAKSLVMLRECLDSVASNSVELREKERQLRNTVNELSKFIREAELEPNFWFLPFPVSCYNMLHGSLAKITDLLVFMIHAMELLAQESHEIMNETIKGDLDYFKILIVSLLKCFEDVIQIESLARFEKKYLEKEAGSNDIETGKEVRQCGHEEASNFDEKESENIAVCFLRRANESISRESKSQMVLCLATLGFCTGGLMREVKEMEKGVIELLQWENPSCHINLHEISRTLKEASV